MGYQKNRLQGGQEKSLKLYERTGHPQSDTPPIFETVTEWLHHGFENYASSTALVFESTVLDYDRLQGLTNKVANYLIKQGISNGDRIGVCLERSVEMIACVIGILKSGAAYVPLDPNYPKDRLDAMKEDADLSLLITHENFADRFDIPTDNVAIWENIETEVRSFPDTKPPVVVEGEDVAYVIFTSGSTGRPKGISMPHRALANLIEWQLERSYFKKGKRVLQYSSISFDVSFQEIATTLASGGSLHLIKDDDRRDARILLKKLNEWKIERLFIPFVALRSLVEVAISTNSMPNYLKEVITAGEQLRVDDTFRTFFTRLTGSALDNQYGPSETHVISAHLLGNDPSEWPDLPPIGQPLKNTSIYLLDEHMEPVEDGTPGELYLGGRNVAHGYINREDLTKKSFVQNPYNHNHPILYKTGDLGLWHNGAIEFLGRSDHQIKIRGHRIEPGEINTVGAKFPGVSQCFTHASLNEAGTARLITYFICKDGNQINKKAFKEHLSEFLPPYMVPSFIMQIEKVPYTPSGKVDLKSLPKPQSENLNANNKKVIYKSETEAKLARIWGELLGFERISRSARFFDDLGGDSLLGMTLIIKIEKQFNKILPLSSLAEDPALKELAVQIEGGDDKIDLSNFRSLQLIQQGDKNKTPLFLIHGGGGNVLLFSDLAKALDDDIPIFAFQWSGWDGRRGEEEILEMAKSYKEELQKFWPTGPYRIGGHCIGGVIALEVARLLRSEGAEILNPLLVSDAPNLNSKYYHLNEPEDSNEDLKNFKRLQEQLKFQMPHKTKKENSRTNAIDTKVETKDKWTRIYLLNPILKLFKKLPGYKLIRSRILSLFSLINSGENRRKMRLALVWLMLKFSKPIPVKYRSDYSGNAMIKAIKKHKNSVYKGDILYLRSELVYGRYLGLQGWWEDMFMGFEELCAGRFDSHVIGGGHNDIFKDQVALKIIKEKMFSNNKN